MENSRPDNHPWYDKPAVCTKNYQVVVSASQTVEAEDRDHVQEIVEMELGTDWSIDEVEIYRN